MTKQLIAALALTALILLPTSAALANDKRSNDDTNGKKASHDIYVTVVSVDPDAKTLTYRGPDGNEQSGEVKGDAVNKLRDLRPGQQVTLVVSDQSMSGSTGTSTNPVVTDIKFEKASGQKG